MKNFLTKLFLVLLIMALLTTLAFYLGAILTGELADPQNSSYEYKQDTDMPFPPQSKTPD